MLTPCRTSGLIVRSSLSRTRGMRETTRRGHPTRLRWCRREQLHQRVIHHVGIHFCAVVVRRGCVRGDPGESAARSILPATVAAWSVDGRAHAAMPWRIVAHCMWYGGRREWPLTGWSLAFLCCLSLFRVQLRIASARMARRIDSIDTSTPTMRG
jgi:hypothetical protein